MVVDLKQLKCGSCGCDLFRLFTQDKTKAIIAECTKCKSTTIIQPSEPSLNLNWGEGSNGILSIF